MPNEQEIRGTKNLGLIKAIHAGIQPPLNIKIIWYDDNLGQKIHKVYNVELGAWVPLSGNQGGIVIEGHYVYTAYASNCEGDDFNFDFDENIHTHLAIMAFENPLDINSTLDPAIIIEFVKRLVKICNSDDEPKGGNYTYIAFADDNQGTNFGLEYTYEEPSGTCVGIDTYTPFTPSTPDTDYSITPSNGGINIDLNSIVSPNTIEILLADNGSPLITGLEYCINLQVPSNFPSDFFIRLDDNEIGGYFIEKGNSNLDLKFKKTNNSSKLIIEFIDAIKPGFVNTLFVKISNFNCCDENPNDPIIKCRSCWAIITSDEPIDNLTVDLFEGKWVCKCCDKKPNEDLENLKALIYNISDKFENKIDSQINSEIITSSNSIELSNFESNFKVLTNKPKQTDVNWKLPSITDNIGKNLTVINLSKNQIILETNKTDEFIIDSSMPVPSPITKLNHTVEGNSTLKIFNNGEHWIII